MIIRTQPDPELLAAAAADEIADWLRTTNHPSFGLAGGSTPRRAYELLRTAELPWDHIHAWLTDERHVPISDPYSNAGMARDALLDHVPAILHTVRYDNNPEAAAHAYERELVEMWDSFSAAGPGLILLGVGDDGHTASLFPGSAALEVDESGYVANWVPNKGAWRLTATMPMLAAAERIVFLASGQAKAKIVAEILCEHTDHPAGVVARAAKDVVWLLDEAAASHLR